MKPKPRLFLWVSLGIILVISPIIAISLLSPKTSSAWFDDDFTIRQYFSFTHNADISAERAITFSLDTAELITDGVMQADCDDVRFTDINGNPLVYEITGGDACNNASTDFEVVFTVIFNGLNAGYVYYNNPSAANNQNDTSTFTALTPSGGDPSLTTRTAEEEAPTPILYWKLDEGQGTTAQDNSERDLDGTITNATWEHEICTTNSCLSFDGTGDYISRADSGQDLDITAAESVTVQAWIRHSGIATNPDVIIEKYESTGADGGYRLQMESDGDLSFGIDDANNDYADDLVTSTTANYDDNQWHLVTGVKNGTTDITLYIDGQLIVTDSTIGSTGTLANNDTLYVGIAGDGSSNGWTGFIDEVKIYPYARTLAQIRQDYNKNLNADGASVVLGTADKNTLAKGLVGWWKLNETSANTCTGGTNDACDSSGNDNDGAWTGNATSATGKYGAAVTFDDANDYISIADSNDLSITTDMTISAWVNVTAFTSQESIVGKTNSNNAAPYDWYLDDTSGRNGRDYFWLDDGSAGGACSSLGDNPPSTGTWAHLVVTVKNLAITHYLNGEFNGQDTCTDTLTRVDADTALYIGNRNDLATDFNGEIDEVRIYNRALSPNEVHDLYNYAPEPVGYWPLDENTGVPADTAEVKDLSGNDSHGELGASMTEEDWVPGKFGSALEFDGTDDYINMTDVDILDFTGPFTTTAWFYPTSVSGGRTILSKYDYTNQRSYLVQIASDDLNIIVYDESTDGFIYKYDAGGNEVSTNTWYHIGVVYDGGSTNAALKVYLNGVNITGTVTESGSFTAPENISGIFCVGCDATSGTPGELFIGKIDDVRVYNYARTPGQIIEDMNGGHPIGGSPVGSPALHLKFDEGFGDTANDSSPNGNDGNLGGATSCPQSGDSACPTWSDGKINHALNFDTSGATDDYISVTDDNSLDIGEKLTITGWFNVVDTASPRSIIFKSSEYLIRIESDDAFAFFLYDGTDYEPHLEAASNPNAGEWYHFAAVYDSTLSQNHQKLYINGILNDQQDREITTSATTNSINIGGYSSSYFDGMIDELKIYQTALTPEQILIDMNQGSSLVLGSTGAETSAGAGDQNAAAQAYCPPGSPASCTAPVGHWKFDEKTDDTCNGTADVCDISGNEQHGTNTNSPVWNSTANCHQGACLEFDGSSSYVDIGTGPSTVRTISFWAYPETTTEYFINLTGTTDYIEASSGTLDFVGDSSETIYVNGTQSTSLTADQWQHILITTTANENASNLDFARTQNTNYLQGRIDDIRIYDYVRDTAQIAWDYNRGAPIGYYKFDDCQGTTAYNAALDSTGEALGGNGTLSIGASGTNTSAGTCSSGTSTEVWNNGTTGKYSASIDLDGTDDYVSLATANLPTGDFTYAVWAYHDNSDSETILNISDGSGNDELSIEYNAGSLRTEINNVQKCNAGPQPFPTGEWVHLTMTRDGTSVSCYVNGLEDETTSDSNTLNFGGCPVLIGTNNGTSGCTDSLNQYWTGQIDDVRIYNYALTLEQVRSIMTTGATSFGE